MTKEEIFAKIKEILVSDFEVDEAVCAPTASLMDDLDLDSIDFVDMIVKMKEYIPERINPDVFRNVRTLQDVVDKLEPYVNKTAAAQ